MDEIYNIQHASAWLSVSWLRRLRGSLCSIKILVGDSSVETKSGSICSFILKRYGLINRIPYEDILSVDLKGSHKVELIFNEHQYVERKLSIYTDSAKNLVNWIGKKMESSAVLETA